MAQKMKMPTYPPLAWSTGFQACRGLWRRVHRPNGRRDWRGLALVAVVGGVLLLGALVSVGMQWEGATTVEDSPFSGLKAMAQTEPKSEALPPLPQVDPKDPQAALIKDTLEQAAKDIQSRRYGEALHRLHTEHELLKPYAEAYLMMGMSLEGLKQMETARDFYAAAWNLDPKLEAAAWGFATTSEALGDLESALSGMRSFLHTTSNPDPERLKVAQARSAIWEWESKLGRGLWGPTKGVPPDFHPDELKRDDRGVGIKVPIPGQTLPGGAMRYEIKTQDKFKMHKTEDDYVQATPSGRAASQPPAR